MGLALSKGPNRAGVSLPLYEDGNVQFPKRCFVVVWNSGRWTKSRNSVILSVMQHRQNPLDCNGLRMCVNRALRRIFGPEEE
jgi:hypothetical protein